LFKPNTSAFSKTNRWRQNK